MVNMGRPKGVNWLEYDSLLGTMPDTELAEKLGVTKQSIGARRKVKGIPAFTGEAAKPSKAEPSKVVKAVPEQPAVETQATPKETATEGREELILKSDEVKIPSKWAAKDRRRNSVEGAVEAADPAEREELRTFMGKVYSIEAVAAELHATVRTIQGYCKTKRLRGVKVGNSWIIPAEAVRRFLAGEDEK